jgi:hypothetical protein
MAWEADEWRPGYTSDFGSVPKVRAHADGAVDAQGLLRLVSDVGCPDCGRPVIALCRRWAGEDRAPIGRHLAEAMREQRWHERHTNRRATGG